MHQVLEGHLFSLHINKGPGHVTLALAGAIVYRDQEAVMRLTFPGKGQKSVPAVVAVPDRADFQELPAALQYFGAFKARQEDVIRLDEL